VSDGVQPGVRIDEELWQQFRDEVDRRRGCVRGHLKTELENALRGYIHGGDVTPAEINHRLQRIESAVGAAESDGGTDTFDAETHTHAPTDAPDEKPASNATTEKKVRWLAHRFVDTHEFEADRASDLPKSALRDFVREEYGFRRDTAKRYVRELIDHFDLRESPDPDSDLLVTEARYDELLAEHRAEADDKIDDL
jgi:hypothetical protein